MKNDNIILISLILLILSLIGLDLCLNKRGVLRESFQTIDYSAAIKNMSESNGEPVGDNRSESKHINSIVSKYTGKVLNVEGLREPPTNTIMVPFFDNKGSKRSLSVNEDGTYSLVVPNKTSLKQQFLVIFIDGVDTYSKHIPLKNETLGYDITDAKYPFYILKSHADITKALQYQDGNVMVRPLANYDSQKWDISYDKIANVIGTHKRNYESKLSGDYRANPDELGSNEYGDLDKIKIKLNLDNQVISRFLEKNLGESVKDSDDESVYDENNGKINLGSNCPLGSYDDKVPENAIRSLCPGCNPNNL